MDMSKHNLKYTTQGKEINRHLSRINTDPNHYTPAFIDKDTGEILDSTIILMSINQVKCFEKIKTDHSFKIFESRRINLNKFWVRIFEIDLPCVNRSYESLTLKASILNGNEFCPLILGWGVKEIGLGDFERIKSKYQSFFNNPSPRSSTFVSVKEELVLDSQITLFDEG